MALIKREALLNRRLPNRMSHQYADPHESAGYNFHLGYATATADIRKIIEEEPEVDAIPRTDAETKEDDADA